MTARLGRWLQMFGERLEERDADGVADLFAEDALYYETPFTAPFRGRSAIRESVAGFAASRADVRFEYDLLCGEESRGVVWWRLTSRTIAAGAEVEVDGIFVFSLDEHDRCPLYREWWHKRERAAT